MQFNSITTLCFYEVTCKLLTCKIIVSFIWVYSPTLKIPLLSVNFSVRFTEHNHARLEYSTITYIYIWNKELKNRRVHNVFSI